MESSVRPKQTSAPTQLAQQPTTHIQTLESSVRPKQTSVHTQLALKPTTHIQTLESSVRPKQTSVHTQLALKQPTHTQTLENSVRLGQTPIDFKTVTKLTVGSKVNAQPERNLQIPTSIVVQLPRNFQMPFKTPSSTTSKPTNLVTPSHASLKRPLQNITDSFLHSVSPSQSQLKEAHKIIANLCLICRKEISVPWMSCSGKDCSYRVHSSCQKKDPKGLTIPSYFCPIHEIGRKVASKKRLIKK